MRDGGHCSLGESRSASSHSVEDVSLQRSLVFIKTFFLGYSVGQRNLYAKKIATESENRLSLYIF